MSDKTKDVALERSSAKPVSCGSANGQGRRIVVVRRMTLATVFVAVLISLAFDLGLGTPSSFGIGEFFLLCPLGGIEVLVASKAFIPITMISAGIVLVIALIFGRAWCAWGCPAPVVRKFFKRDIKVELSGEWAGGSPCSSS